MKNSVFITTSTLGYGSGGGSVCYNICKALKKTTNLIGVLAACGSFPSDLQVPCINIRPESFKQPANPFLFDYFAYWNLPKEHIDIAHFYGSPFGVTAREIKRRNPDATIIIDIPAHNLELSVEEHQKFMGGYPYHHMVDPFLWPVFCEHVSLADIIISPSSVPIRYMRTSETFHKLLGFRQKDIPMVLIPHGTVLPPMGDIKPFPEKFNVATLSQCGLDKGQIYLAMAWKQLENIYPPNLGYSCNIAGYGTESLNNFIQQNDIKNIKTGTVENVADVYNNCNVYVHPSVTEGFGITVLEAMAHGRACIVSEETGAVDLIEDGKNGFIIPTRNVNVIMDKIRWFYDNPDECKKMGQEARKVAESYSWDLIRPRYEKLYETL